MTLVTGTVVGSAGPAAADGAGQCGGTLIDRSVVRYDGAAIGELVVYYNASNGNNCARFNHLGAAYGVERRTVVQLYRCAERSPADCTPTVLAQEDEAVSFYAGPVRVYSPANCVSARGAIQWAGAVRAVSSGTIGC